MLIFKSGEKILLQKLSTKREGAEILNFIQKCRSFRPLTRVSMVVLFFTSGGIRNFLKKTRNFTVFLQ